MPIQPINYGAAPNDGTGDSLREAMRKAQANFDHLNLSKVSAEEGKSLMTAAESTKLGSVATNASANSSDAFLLNRANHTGTQPVSTIAGLEAQTSNELLAAIAMAKTFTAVPTTFQAFLIVVTLPHVRLMQWNGTKYVRSPLGQMPGTLRHVYRNLRPGELEVRADVTLQSADFPDLAEYLSVTGPTFVLDEARAEFIRNADSGRGVDAGRAIGSAQGDAIRDIQADLGVIVTYRVNGAAVAVGWTNDIASAPKDTSLGTGTMNFKASRVVPTAAENRPRNVSYRFAVTY